MDWEAYPESWPKPDRPSRPLGMARFSARIKDAADRRKAAIRNDLASAGPHYPRVDVRKVLDYWNISL